MTSSAHWRHHVRVPLWEAATLLWGRLMKRIGQIEKSNHFHLPPVCQCKQMNNRCLICITRGRERAANFLKFVYNSIQFNKLVVKFLFEWFSCRWCVTRGGRLCLVDAGPPPPKRGKNRSIGPVSHKTKSHLFKAARRWQQRNTLSFHWVIYLAAFVEMSFQRKLSSIVNRWRCVHQIRWVNRPLDSPLNVLSNFFWV